MADGVLAAELRPRALPGHSLERNNHQARGLFGPVVPAGLSLVGTDLYHFYQYALLHHFSPAATPLRVHHDLHGAHCLQGTAVLPVAELSLKGRPSLQAQSAAKGIHTPAPAFGGTTVRPPTLAAAADRGTTCPSETRGPLLPRPGLAQAQLPHGPSRAPKDAPARAAVTTAGGDAGLVIPV